jgi:hypothetical protein
MESACRGTLARSTAAGLATRATGLLPCGSAQAATLTFDGVAMPGPAHNASDGDRVSTFGPSLGPAGRPTPHIVLDFVPTPFAVFANGCHTLSHALDHTNFNQPPAVSSKGPAPGRWGWPGWRHWAPWCASAAARTEQPPNGRSPPPGAARQPSADT